MRKSWLWLCTLATLLHAEGDPVTPDTLTPETGGLLILLVSGGGQAEAAGIKPLDVLVAYDGAALRTPADLKDAMGKAKTSGAESVPLELLRGKERIQAAVKPGPLGIQSLPVEKGKAIELRPAATLHALDFGKLDAGPREEWYVFTLDGKTPVGFEHMVLALREGRLELVYEVAFNGGEQWGVNHFVVHVQATVATPIRLLEIRFEEPRSGFVALTRPSGDGQWETEFQHRPEGPAHVRTAVPLGTWPEHLDLFLPLLMPRQQGACFHFQSFVDGLGSLGGASALFCTGQEETQVLGVTTKAWRYEVKSMGRVNRTTWVDEEGRIVKNDYQGAVSYRTDRAKALAGLPSGLEPRTAAP